MLSSATSPVKALLSTLLTVEAYFTEKEIIGKKREKKKRGEEEKEKNRKRKCFPPSRVTFDANVGHVPSSSAYRCTLWKRGNQKEEE